MYTNDKICLRNTLPLAKQSKAQQAIFSIKVTVKAI